MGIKRGSGSTVGQSGGLVSGLSISPGPPLPPSPSLLSVTFSCRKPVLICERGVGEIVSVIADISEPEREVCFCLLDVYSYLCSLVSVLVHETLLRLVLRCDCSCCCCQIFDVMKV